MSVPMMPPTETTTLKGVLAATVRGAGKAPHQSYQRALSHQGEPSLAGHTRFSSIVAATGHVGLISKTQGTLCRPPFPQVVGERQGGRDAFLLASPEPAHGGDAVG
jgi:hypothetical protein